MQTSVHEQVYFFGNYPKLKAKIQLTQKRGWGSDFEAEIELFDMKGNKLFEFETYDLKRKGKSLLKTALCFDDFFVLDSHLVDKTRGIDRCFFRAYDYNANLILSEQNSSWDDAEGYKKVRLKQKYDMLDESGRMW
ncbi:MAG: hypothetical protein IJW24_00605 [Clostridia bacterium]|nr:hypothetical protein [Clostridia bacterium]